MRSCVDIGAIWQKQYESFFLAELAKLAKI